MIKIYTDSRESLVELREDCSLFPENKNKVRITQTITGAFLDWGNSGKPLFLYEVILNGRLVYFTEALIDKLFNGEATDF